MPLKITAPKMKRKTTYISRRHPARRPSLPRKIFSRAVGVLGAGFNDGGPENWTSGFAGSASKFKVGPPSLSPADVDLTRPARVGKQACRKFVPRAMHITGELPGSQVAFASQPEPGRPRDTSNGSQGPGLRPLGTRTCHWSGRLRDLGATARITCLRTAPGTRGVRSALVSGRPRWRNTIW